MDRLNRLSRFLEKFVVDDSYEANQDIHSISQDSEAEKPKPKKIFSIYPSQEVQDRLTKYFYDCKA